MRNKRQETAEWKRLLKMPLSDWPEYRLKQLIDTYAYASEQGYTITPEQREHWSAACDEFGSRQQTRSMSAVPASIVRMAR